MKEFFVNVAARFIMAVAAAVILNTLPVPFDFADWVCAVVGADTLRAMGNLPPAGAKK